MTRKIKSIPHDLSMFDIKASESVESKVVFLSLTHRMF